MRSDRRVYLFDLTCFSGPEPDPHPPRRSYGAPTLCRRIRIHLYAGLNMGMVKMARRLHHTGICAASQPRDVSVVGVGPVLGEDGSE